MKINYTKRIVEYLYQLHENFQRSSRANLLEKNIDGMQMDKPDATPAEYEKAFRNLIIGQTGFTDKEYEQTVLPLKILDGKEFEQNPYLQNIILNDYHEKNIVLSKDTFSKGELMMYDGSSFNSDFSQKIQFCVFNKDIPTYIIGTDDFVWMSICPSEVNTMKKCIQNTRGRLLVLGGGLGYFPYMCSLKDDIASITIIEKDHVIKKILEEQIIPQFPNNKTKVIEADAFTFMKSDISDQFDSVFADIWENNFTGIDPYKKFVKYEKKYPKMHFDYWLEDNILGSVSSYIFMYFETKMDSENEKFFSKQYPDIYKYLENITDRIERPDQIKYFLTQRFAKEMLINLEPV